MIQQVPVSRISKTLDLPAATVPVALCIWTLSYLAIDLIMWAGGRSTLVSNIVISLPMMLTAPVLTIALERLRRQLLHLAPALIAALIVPAAFGAAVLQGLVDYSSVRLGAALLFPDWQDYVPTENRQFGFGIYVYALHFLCCLLALTLLQAQRSVQMAVERQTEAVSAHRRAEAKALRLQLNPHFLFNALNSIAALVAIGGNRVADAMIWRLSDFLRASIVGDPESDVSLSSEIATIESYLSIEQLRFGDRLQVEWRIAPDAWDAAVPGLILQPLAENAVKHGLAKTRSTIRLIIEVQRIGGSVTMSVTDRRASSAASCADADLRGAGIGLANVRQRLTLFGTDRARLETELLPDGFRAQLTLPYRKFSCSRGDLQ